MANIRTASRSGRVFRGGRHQSDTAWFGDSATTETVVAGGAGALLSASLTAIELAFRPFTVLRSRGIMFVRSDQQAATEVQDVALGLAVVSDQAVGVGITAVPAPTDDDDSDLWFVYERLMSDIVFGTAASFARMGQFTSVDSKAMRKVEDGQDIVKVYQTSVNSSGVFVRSHVRLLIKLH